MSIASVNLAKHVSWQNYSLYISFHSFLSFKRRQSYSNIICDNRKATYLNLTPSKCRKLISSHQIHWNSLMNLFFISLFFFFNTVPISGFSSTLSSQFSPFSSIPFCYLFYSFLCNSTSFFLFSFSNILFLHHSPVFHFLLILHLLTLLFTSDFLLIYFFFLFSFTFLPSFFLSRHLILL